MCFKLPIENAHYLSFFCIVLCILCVNIFSNEMKLKYLYAYKLYKHLCLHLLGFSLCYKYVVLRYNLICNCL